MLHPTSTWLRVVERCCCLQVDGWPWLAEGLPQLQTLVLRRVRMGTDGLWPAALADCTGLQALTLEGDTAAPFPDGPYLERLRTLDWLCDPYADVPNALVAATALEQLRLTVAPKRMADCSVLDSLPNLRHLEVVASDSSENVDESNHTEALAELRQRLRATVSFR